MICLDDARPSTNYNSLKRFSLSIGEQKTYQMSKQNTSSARATRDPTEVKGRFSIQKVSTVMTVIHSKSQHCDGRALHRTAMRLTIF